MCIQIHQYICTHTEQKPTLCRRYQGMQGRWSRFLGRVAHTWPDTCDKLLSDVNYISLPCRRCRNEKAAKEEMRGYREWMASAAAATTATNNSSSNTTTSTTTTTTTTTTRSSSTNSSNPFTDGAYPAGASNKTDGSEYTSTDHRQKLRRTPRNTGPALRTKFQRHAFPRYVWENDDRDYKKTCHRRGGQESSKKPSPKQHQQSRRRSDTDAFRQVANQCPLRRVVSNSLHLRRGSAGSDESFACAAAREVEATKAGLCKRQYTRNDGEGCY